MTEEKFLADRLYEVCAASKLAPEHLEIAGLLKQAERFVVDTATAAIIRDELDRRSWNIESNLDLIEWSADPVWIEWGLPARVVEQHQLPGKTGCLITQHPEHEGLMMIVTAWEDVAHDTVHHSYSTALIDLSITHDHARAARSRYTKDNDDSFERMISILGITQPDGFRDELVLRHKGNVGVIERTMRLGTAEIPYLFALLVACQAQGGLMADLAEDHAHLVLMPALQKTVFEKLEDKLWNAPETGLFRRVKSRKPVLKWYRAA
jgi:hypothetical protein